MRKFILCALTFIGLGFGTIFAQNNVLPDEAKIEVKSPIIQGEATNLTVTMMKNGSKMTPYEGTIYISVTDKDGFQLNSNEYTVPKQGLYTFSNTDLGSTTFEKGLEIKKDGQFFIEVIDFNDPSETPLGREPITVIKGDPNVGKYKINVLSPVQNVTLTNERVEIIATVPELKNSNAIIYLDDNMIDTTLTDSQGMINYVIKDVSIGTHWINIEVLDMDGSTLGSSEKIYFTTTPAPAAGIEVTVDPETGLMVGDVTKITVKTDEMVESVKMKLSDRSENDSEVLSKIGNGLFSKDVFLFKTGTINISLETSASMGSIVQNFDNIKQFSVSDTPVIGNIITGADAESQVATISRDVINGSASSYLIGYWLGDNQSSTQEERTEEKSFKFTDVPYDTALNVTITPYRSEATKHGAASQTIKFIITKPQPGQENTGNANTDPTGVSIKPRCIVENISTRTTKIGDNYYLIWDKIENVSKYIVYSSTMPDGSDKMKVYETTDTSYQYPFDKTSEEDKFAYFWIVGICDDGQELELTGATKVQVGPAENFFLLLCMTFLIYSGIKLFRQTEE